MPAKHQIYVEGVNDQHVVRNLLGVHGVDCVLFGPVNAVDSLAVRNMNGYETLLRSLESGLDEPTLERLAIIVDADTNLDARWQSLRNRLNHLGASLPDTPDTAGVISMVQRPDRDVSVGIWLMPNNQLPGNLETFAAFLIRTGDVLWPHAQSTVSTLPEQRFHETAREKANMHTWLSWQEKPGLPLGQAITAHYLDTDAPYALQLVAWLKALFNPPLP
jgi:hypothetical protein